MRYNETFRAQGRDVPLNGRTDGRFGAVVEAFCENYRVEDEVGSALSIVVDGTVVVDVWGGWKDGLRAQEWQHDTIVCMMSVAKGISALCFAMLIERGLVDIDAPVSKYWPEFAQAGKEDMPVRYVLDHRSGMPVVVEKLWPGAYFDRDAIVGALARQAPLWAPGTTAAYQINVLGFILSEIMRRVDGRTITEFLRDEVALPLDADYHIGLAERDLARCAQLLPNDDAKLLAARHADPEDLRARASLQMPDAPWSVVLNSREWRQAEFGSGNGHGTARAVARIYAAFANGGELDGVRLASPETIKLITREQHHQVEIMQGRHYRQALGLLLNTPAHVYMGPNPNAFGHHGIGGSIGFADPDAKIGFCYSMNRFHAGGDNGPRARRIINALYDCLGST